MGLVGLPTNTYLHSPYKELPDRQFWRRGVVDQHILTVQNFWRKKFDILPDDKIVAAGSCFAQHIAKRLCRHGFDYLDAEPAPSILPEAEWQRFGYNIYSGRYGNIYTSVQLQQLAEEALGLIDHLPYSWEREGRFFDPLRPSVEPNGLKSHEEVQFHRRYHLERFRYLLSQGDVFIFTFGLTEAWRCKRTGRVLPTAPGTIAGDYDPALYEFVNLTFEEVRASTLRFMELVNGLHGDNPRRFLFTVSPVPLTATAMEEHVLPATMYSKSVLRAVAGELSAANPMIDYFPSYEVISAPWSRGIFYEPNLRTVTPAGVDAAMRIFFLQHGGKIANGEPARQEDSSPRKSDINVNMSDDDVVCEEVLLEAFAQ